MFVGLSLDARTEVRICDAPMFQACCEANDDIHFLLMCGCAQAILPLHAKQFYHSMLSNFTIFIFIPNFSCIQVLLEANRTGVQYRANPPRTVPRWIALRVFTCFCGKSTKVAHCIPLGHGAGLPSGTVQFALARFGPHQEVVCRGTLPITTVNFSRDRVRVRINSRVRVRFNINVTGGRG